MGRRARRPAGERPAPKAPEPKLRALNAPFADLGKRLRAVAPPPKPAPRPVPAPPAEPDESVLLARAMADVVPLSPHARARIDPAAPATGPRPPISEEAEALAALSDLVTGASRFDITDTREYIEGAVIGLDPRLLRRLRRGDFAWQTYIDLHGMTAGEARIAVDRFLAEAVKRCDRCVLIVHGRGLNSKDQTPVLKERLKSWLARGSAARIVLAFATARPADGGAGALYVLLRRDRQRRAIRVTEGTAS